MHTTNNHDTQLKSFKRYMNRRTKGSLWLCDGNHRHGKTLTKWWLVVRRSIWSHAENLTQVCPSVRMQRWLQGVAWQFDTKAQWADCDGNRLHFPLPQVGNTCVERRQLFERAAKDHRAWHRERSVQSNATHPKNVTWYQQRRLHWRKRTHSIVSVCVYTSSKPIVKTRCCPKFNQATFPTQPRRKLRRKSNPRRHVRWWATRVLWCIC